MTCASDCITLASESAAMHPPRISGLGNLYLWCKRQEAGTSTAGEYSNPGANSLISTVFGEEEQPGDGCEHALELVDRAAVAAAFPAEHPPCLHLCHGVLDGGADLAEDRVEFTLPVQEFRSAEALEWHDPDAVDSDVAEVGASIAGGHGFLQYFFEAGGLERVGIVPCAVHGNRADSGHAALEIARDLHVHSRVLCLPGIQVRDRVPVPHRADGAVDQGSSLAAEHLDGIGNIGGENLADYRAQQVPPPADRRLAAMEMRCCGSLGCIAAHQHDDHDHRVEQPDRRRLFRAGLDQRADLLHDQEAQLVQLPGGQPCESIVLQRFLLVILSVLTTMDLKGGAVAMSRVSRHSQETFIFACGIVENFPSCRPSEFRSGEIQNAMNE